MKSVWTGDIGFGLVTIPIKLYSATQKSELNFDMLDQRDHSNIRYKRVNGDTGKEVPWDNIVKGYELDGKYIVLTDKDFSNASPEKTKRIEIVEFVEESDIDSLYFEQPYYTEPAKNGAKPYALFREALLKTKKAGLSTFVLRNKEHLGLIKVVGNVIVLHQIRFEEEIRSTEDLNIPAKGKIEPGQLKMASSLIDQMAADFDISRYKDTYTEQLLKYIKARAKGKKPVKPKMKVAHKQSDDLMDQLKESLKVKRKKTS
ncbi:MAG TPA: Ku protein [Chitinophagaceae bacterium]|jgi:DNA end-binding protein Ku|nr:Ku protein [Chitinophagaceae bacterium]